MTKLYVYVPDLEVLKQWVEFIGYLSYIDQGKLKGINDLKYGICDYNNIMDFDNPYGEGYKDVLITISDSYDRAIIRLTSELNSDSYYWYEDLNYRYAYQNGENIAFTELFDRFLKEGS